MNPPPAKGVNYLMLFARIEKRLMRWALSLVDNNRQEAAGLLCMKRTTFTMKMHKYNMREGTPITRTYVKRRESW